MILADANFVQRHLPEKNIW